MATDTKKYLEYLDKEMTIMGILSAVAIAAPAGILNALLGEDKSGFKERIWGAGPFFIILGSVFCILAALCFYKQRSLLAWYYGQMCLLESLDDNTSIPEQLRKYMRDVDSWEEWLPYSWGFDALTAGFVEFVSATFFVLASANSRLSLAAMVIGRSFPILVLAFAILQHYVYKRYTFSDALWSDFWSKFLQKEKTKLPHENVYTRLKPSSISGVGVFAICNIPTGTYVFEPDDEELVSIRDSEVDALSPVVRQLYTDFCVRKGSQYQCPSTFNDLTPSWYLNHSESPNVAADPSLKFYAIRDIQAGEELVADYRTYSDNDPISGSSKDRIEAEHEL